MTLKVIDIETTGTDPQTDAIIEVASVNIDPAPSHGYTIASPQSHLIGLPVSWGDEDRRIPPEACAVHHIIASDLDGKPELKDVIASYKSEALIAHNAKFERSFLDAYFGPGQLWVCTYKCALRAWPDAPGHSNQVLRYWLGLIEPFGWTRENLPTHRALGDAVVTAAIFVKLLEAGTKWSDMIAWSKEPALLPKFTFGKHRGEKIGDVPHSYLEWIIYKSDMDEDVKHSSARELTRRNSGSPKETDNARLHP